MNESLWDFIENRLFYKKLGMFYDTVIDENTAVPSLSDIKNGIPNINGCGTMTEDAMISGGTALQGLILRIQNSGKGIEFAESVTYGLLTCAESGKDGFLPRSIQPVDGLSHYADTSRDQITMLFYGLLLYYFSGHCCQNTKRRIENVIKSAVDRAARNVTPENGYDLLTENGEPSVNCVMWGDSLKPHEVGRLPFMYLCDFAVNGRDSSFKKYTGLRDEAIARSHPIGDHRHFYTLQQMAATLDVARRFDKEYSAEYQKLLEETARYTAALIKTTEDEIFSFSDEHFLARTDWRKFYSVQNAAIIAITEYTAYGSVSESAADLVVRVAEKLDVKEQRSALPIHFAAALEMIRH